MIKSMVWRKSGTAAGMASSPPISQPEVTHSPLPEETKQEKLIFSVVIITIKLTSHNGQFSVSINSETFN